MNNNIILLSDSYKYSHASQYLPNTTGVYSYFESRKGAKYPYTVFFGLQYVIKRYLEGVVVTKEKVDQAEKIINAHLGPGIFDRSRWDYIVEKHGGKLPVCIKAVKEGTVVPECNVLMTVENTDKNCPWLTNFIETLLTHVWYTSTVATLSHYARKELTRWLVDTGCKDLSAIAWMLHNFSARGVENMEAAAASAAAHLLSFSGTDNIMALTFPHEFYNEPEDYICGYSVRATEHSVMTARGEDGEWEVVDYLMKNNPDGILSVVIDSYNYERFIETLCTKYKDEILNRNGRIVFRPDSGDPMVVSQRCLELVGKHLGYTVNEKGYKVLPNCARVLWGDGIDVETMLKIVELSAKNGWAAENWVFGVGGGLAQKLNRDTQRFAMKCCAQKYDGEWHDVWKKSSCDWKGSKRGRLALVKDANNEYKTVRENEAHGDNLLETVFLDGELVRNEKFSGIKGLVQANLLPCYL